jgi:acetolactate synthase-like protein
MEWLLCVGGLLALGLIYAIINFIPFGNVVESERHGGEIAANVLKAHGVEFIFTLVGGHISPILVECKKQGVRVIDVRMEANAVFAADAVSRLSGVPGVAAVTAGPGVTNTITAIKNAQMAQSPLVLIGGAAATLLKGRGALQDIDQMVLLRPICKYCATCSSVKDIAPTLRRAFQEAQSGVPGPVFVELPIDVLYPIAEVRSNMGLGVRKRARDIKKDDQAEVSRIILPVEAEARGETRKAFLDAKRSDQPVFLVFDDTQKLIDV